MEMEIEGERRVMLDLNRIGKGQNGSGQWIQEATSIKRMCLERTVHIMMSQLPYRLLHKKAR